MPSKKGKDSKRLKQTTLFDSPKLTKRNPKELSIKKISAKTAHSSDGGGIHFGPVTVVSSEEEDVPSPSRLKHKRRLTRLASESPSEELNPLAQVNSTSQSDPDIEDLVPRKKRRLRRRSSDNSIAEVDNLDQLVDEVDEEDILDSRLRIRNKKSSYQKNLEKLKRRKLKTNTPPENESTADERVDHEGPSSPFKGAKPSSEINSLEDEESGSSESSDFIVDDDNVFQLPAEFSMETHQDLSHQFKKIFEFFVHIAVRPPKRRSSFMKKKLTDEEYFSAPLKVMRRKLLGIRDSLVASSVWKPAFKKGLERHPEFSLTRLGFAVPCDACHLGGRMSTLIGRLTGSQYDSSGFDPFLSDDNSDEGVEYHLGRFCARRARVYHEFCHWEYELFQCISRELGELRSSLDGGFHRIAYFHGTEPPDDLSDADAICEWLDQRQIIDREWQKLETLMESAHRLEMHRKNGDDD